MSQQPLADTENRHAYRTYIPQYCDIRKGLFENTCQNSDAMLEMKCETKLFASTSLQHFMSIRRYVEEPLLRF